MVAVLLQTSTDRLTEPNTKYKSFISNISVSLTRLYAGMEGWIQNIILFKVSKYFQLEQLNYRSEIILMSRT